MRNLDPDQYQVLAVAARPETAWLPMSEERVLAACRSLERRGLLVSRKVVQMFGETVIYEATPLGEIALRIFEGATEPAEAKVEEPVE